MPCGIDGEERKICFHDYHEIFAVPGLYERIFHDHLECRSPAEVVGLLGGSCGPRRGSGGALRAGRRGRQRDRRGGASGPRGQRARRRRHPPGGRRGRRARPPGVYDDYVACDLTALTDDERRRLARRGAQLPDDRRGAGLRRHAARGVEEAYDIVADDGWIAFNIKADFIDAGTRPASAGSSPTWSAPSALEVCDRSGTATGCRCTASRWTTWRSWVASGRMAVASAA